MTAFSATPFAARLCSIQAARSLSEFALFAVSPVAVSVSISFCSSGVDNAQDFLDNLHTRWDLGIRRRIFSLWVLCLFSGPQSPKSTSGENRKEESWQRLS
jgi:hypothetical protein